MCCKLGVHIVLQVNGEMSEVVRVISILLQYNVLLFLRHYIIST